MNENMCAFSFILYKDEGKGGWGVGEGDGKASMVSKCYQWMQMRT